MQPNIKLKIGQIWHVHRHYDDINFIGRITKYNRIICTFDIIAGATPNLAYLKGVSSGPILIHNNWILDPVTPELMEKCFVNLL